MSIKEEAGEAVLLFYRMGDFYELFFDDAVKAAEALDIALTKRGKHQGADIPMCGVPVHASETYLHRLIKAGFRVAVCEQTEDPQEAKKRGSKSVVRREIVRIVTAGTLTEDTLLEARGSNFILSLYRCPAGIYGLAWADISEGSFYTTDVRQEDLSAEIMALNPREIILPDTLYARPDHLPPIDLSRHVVTPQPKTVFDNRRAQERLEQTFEVKTLDGFGAFSQPEISAAGALLGYISLTQAGQPVQLSPPRQHATSAFMSIDPATRTSLEIERTQSGTRKGSLLSVIDQTITGPGARLLHTRLCRPLLDPAAINARLDEVGFFKSKTPLSETLRSYLKICGDPARALTRLSLGRGGPRDVQIIGTALRYGSDIAGELLNAHGPSLPENLNRAAHMLSLSDKAGLAKLMQDIDLAFKPDAPVYGRDGGFIAKGWSSELDHLTALKSDSRKHIAALQATYQIDTDISSLKIKHNNVLGYFIEVTPRHADVLLAKDMTETFIHRQTLVSGVRFTTTELGDLDAQISSAGDKALALEQAILRDFTHSLSEHSDAIRQQAQALAQIDVAVANGKWAREWSAIRPEIDDSLNFSVTAGRHPVVTSALKRAGDTAFTPNDCNLDASGKSAPRLVLITGPNMAGKSTYLRQNALMSIMAQAGCFVPATHAHIGVADRVFSRVGASDDLSRGRSTFMTEMVETAAILNRATQRSFVILDEIGRGTSTFDGLSIAWATAEHLHAINQCRGLFATHYHELTDMIDALDHATNASLRAKEWDGNLIFLHDIQPGAADKSYGIQVAKLAGLPELATRRAREVLNRLEADQDSTEQALGGLPLFQAPAPTPPRRPSQVETLLADIEPDHLSPREALNVLYTLKLQAQQKS